MQIINLLLRNNLLSNDIILTSSKGKNYCHELLCTIRSLVMVRNQLPAQVVNLFDLKIAIFSQF